jgi:putative ABC transport system permease protein
MVSQDLRYAWRTLRTSPTFSLAATLALALGVGSTTTIFSLVDIVLLRPLPYPQPDRLVGVTTYFPSIDAEYVASSDFLDWSEGNQVFENFAAIGHNLTPAALEMSTGPVPIRAARVTVNFLSTLRVSPILGRTFLPEEALPDGPTPIIISYELWQGKFSGDAKVLGKSVSFDGSLREIVGVMPKAFYFPTKVPVDALVPLQIQEAERLHKAGRTWDAIGRLRPGTTIQQARANFETLFAATKALYPKRYRNVQLRLRPLQEQVTGSVRTALIVLLGAVGCVLLIACANVANLLMARAVGRQREIAIRSALGASRLRLIQQLLTESVLLALIGGAVGVALAMAATKVMHKIGPSDVARLSQVTVDLRVLGFALLISLATGIAFGLAPAMAASRPAARFPRSGPRSLVLVAELALSFILLVGATLLYQSLWGLEHKNLGFTSDNVLTADISLRGTRFQTAARRTLYGELRERLARIPGTQAVAFTDSLPPAGGLSLVAFRGGNMTVRRVSPTYFEALQISLKQGRLFQAADQPAAIINQTAARVYFPGEDPIGKKVEIFGGAIPIIGVVGDVKNQGLDHDPIPEMYQPLDQTAADSGVSVVLRTIGDPRLVAAALRYELRAVDPLLLATIQTMQQKFDEMTTRPRFNSIVFSSFAAVALLLVMIGIYAVVSFTIEGRTREIGIRMALGADARRVLRLVLREAMVPATAGVLGGMFGAVATSRYLSSLLYAVKPTDPATYIGASLILEAVAIVASLVPARRAIRLDLAKTLRRE